MATTIFVVLTLILFSLLVIILFSIIFFLIRAVWRIFPADTETKWISLGIAVFLFSTVIISFISAGITFTTTFFSALSGGIFNIWQNYTQCDPLRSIECGSISFIWFSFLKSWTETFKYAVDEAYLTELPYDRLVLFFAVWAAIILLIGWLRREEAATLNNGKTETQEVHGESRQPIRRKNFLFFIVLLVGGYLSIAAIVSIPSLQDTSEIPSEFTDEKLNEQLSSILYQSENAFKEFSGKVEILENRNLIDELKQKIPSCVDTAYGTDEIADGTDEVADGTDEVADGTDEVADGTDEVADGTDDVADGTDKIKKICNENRKDILERIEDYKSAREDACSKFKVLIANASQDIQNYKDDVQIRYEVSSASRIGNRERIQHFIDLTYWYEGISYAWQANLSQCNDSITNSDSEYLIWRDIQVNSLSSDSSGTELSENIDARDESIISDCERNVRIAPIPQRQDLGSQLGIFSFVASWLLRTESLSLVLIVGLIGFGLLGSSCSTVIREQKKKEKEEQLSGPLVEDLTGVVIRGLLAALVCFLAVKGGLVIFASEGDPNPYALLLTCLLAAIYSEPVWDWAQRYIGRFDKSAPPSTPKPEEPPKETPKETQK